MLQMKKMQIIFFINRSRLNWEISALFNQNALYNANLGVITMSFI